jgi:hypothetical protein
MVGLKEEKLMYEDQKIEEIIRQKEQTPISEFQA